MSSSIAAMSDTSMTGSNPLPGRIRNVPVPTVSAVVQYIGSQAVLRLPKEANARTITAKGRVRMRTARVGSRRYSAQDNIDLDYAIRDYPKWGAAKCR